MFFHLKAVGILALMVTHFLSDKSLAEDIIVRAERYFQNSNTSTAAIQVFESDEIEESSERNLGEFLGKRAGLYYQNNGVGNQLGSLFLRGGDSDSYALVVDGSRYQDSLDPGRKYDPSKLSLKSIEKIEILKGVQSVLYGSDAVSGVILITTLDQKEKQLDASLEFGSDRYQNLSFSASSGRSGSLSFSGGVEVTKEEAESSFNEKRGEGNERDPYQTQSFHGRLKYVLSSHWEVEFSSRHQINEGEIDNFGSDRVDDDQEVFRHQHYQLMAMNSDEESDRTLHFKLNSQRTKRTSDLFGVYDSKMTTLQWNFGQDLGFAKLQTGIEYEKDVGSAASEFQDRQSEEWNFFQQWVLKWKKLKFQPGLRIIHHTAFDTYLVYRVGINYEITNYLFLFSSVGTGYKSPSLYQRFSSFGGQSVLNPEGTDAYELGFKWNRGLYQVEWTSFYQRIRNQIDFSSNKFRNLSEARIAGTEITTEYRVEMIQLQFDYSYILARDWTNRQLLEGRPKNKANIFLRYYFNDIFFTSLSSRWIGRRESFGMMGSQVLFDTRAELNIDETSRLWVAIHDILDRDDEIVRSYGTAGRQFRVGIRKTF